MPHGAMLARYADLEIVPVHSRMPSTAGEKNATVNRGHPRNVLYQRRWFRVNVWTKSTIPAHHVSSSPSTRTHGCPNCCWYAYIVQLRGGSHECNRI